MEKFCFGLICSKFCGLVCVKFGAEIRLCFVSKFIFVFKFVFAVWLLNFALKSLFAPIGELLISSASRKERSIFAPSITSSISRKFTASIIKNSVISSVKALSELEINIFFASLKILKNRSNINTLKLASRAKNFSFKMAIISSIIIPAS